MVAQAFFSGRFETGVNLILGYVEMLLPALFLCVASLVLTVVTSGCVSGLTILAVGFQIVVYVVHKTIERSSKSVDELNKLTYNFKRA